MNHQLTKQVMDYVFELRSRNVKFWAIAEILAAEKNIHVAEHTLRYTAKRIDKFGDEAWSGTLTEQAVIDGLMADNSTTDIALDHGVTREYVNRIISNIREKHNVKTNHGLVLRLMRSAG